MHTLGSGSGVYMLHVPMSPSRQISNANPRLWHNHIISGLLFCWRALATTTGMHGSLWFSKCSCKILISKSGNVSNIQRARCEKQPEFGAWLESFGTASFVGYLHAAIIWSTFGRPLQLQEIFPAGFAYFGLMESKWMSPVSTWHFLKAEARKVTIPTYQVILGK